MEQAPCNSSHYFVTPSTVRTLAHVLEYVVSTASTNLLGTHNFNQPSFVNLIKCFAKVNECDYAGQVVSFSLFY